MSQPSDRQCLETKAADLQKKPDQISAGVASAVRRKTTNSFESLRCDSWEVVLPEIVCLPDAAGLKP